MVCLTTPTIQTPDSHSWRIDTLGIDNDPLLTKSESDYLNSRFAGVRGKFDFEGKRVLFLTGSAGSRVMPKRDYFADVERWMEVSDEIATSLFVLKDEERSVSGYDAIVTAWVKVLTNKRKAQMLRRAKPGR